MRKNCRDCAFFADIDGEGDKGECVYLPPVLMPRIFDYEDSEITAEVDPADYENLMIHTVYPVVPSVGRACGQFQAKGSV